MGACGQPEEVPRGTRVISTTWVDRRRDPSTVKARLCAREYIDGHSDDVFASTPLAFAALLIDLLSCVKNYKTMLGDVASVFLHTPVPEGQEIWLEPPKDYVSTKVIRDACGS